jgi:hypothetical protein
VKVLNSEGIANRAGPASGWSSTVAARAAMGRTNHCLYAGTMYLRQMWQTDRGHWLRDAEQLDHEPAKCFVRVLKREKRACSSCAQGGVQRYENGWEAHDGLEAARRKLAFPRSRGHYRITQTPTRAFMNHQEPEFNPVLTETDSAKTDESIETTRSEIPANERPSYLRSRHMALKKFTSQGGAASAG